MADAGNGSVQLLEADPDLARGLDPRRVREVSQRLFARAIDVPRGTWSPGRALSGGGEAPWVVLVPGGVGCGGVGGGQPRAGVVRAGGPPRGRGGRRAG